LGDLLFVVCFKEFGVDISEIKRYVRIGDYSLNVG
jgi:hypothetical protein